MYKWGYYVCIDGNFSDTSLWYVTLQEMYMHRNRDSIGRASYLAVL